MKSLTKLPFVLVASLMVGCSVQQDEDSQRAGGNGQIGALPETTAAPSPTDEPEKAAGQQLIDPAFKGMVAMGSTKGWSLYFHKETNQVVATDGASSITFDPTRLDDAEMESLARQGIPAEMLWSWKGVLCRAACWAAAGAGCALVAGTCTWGTVITFGGFALPCSWATVAACGGAAGGASVCGDWCTDQFG